MKVRVAPFADRHLDAAAELLAEQITSARRAAPELSERFERASEARKPLEFMWKLPQHGGVVAIAGSRVVGFILGLAFPDDISHYALAPFSAVSESASDRGETLREMYASLGQSWSDAGCVGHYPTVPAGDPEIIEAWYSLGFGQDHVAAIRDVSAPPGLVAPDIDVRRARVEDLDSIQGLNAGLAGHLALSPTFVIEREGWRTRETVEEKLQEDAPDVYWLAMRDGVAIGMLHWEPTRSGFPYIPEGCMRVQHAFIVEDERGSGVGTALFQAGLAWAREAGSEHCVVDWEPANLQAARFWNRHRLRPFSHVLARRLETR